MCGSNGPPGLSHRAAGQLSNCGNSPTGRMPLVEMKDDVAFWLSPDSGPFIAQSVPANGSSIPVTL